MPWKYKFFKPKEVLSPDGLQQLERNNWIRCQEHALIALEEWRHWVDVMISINFADHVRRGYRSSEENRAVKGGKDSAHVQGIAFDQTPHNYPCFDFFVMAVYWSYLRYKAGLIAYRGIGIYPQSNFMHGDFRHNQDDLLILWNGYTKKLLTKAVKFDNIDFKNLDTWLVSELNLPAHWKLTKFTINELLQRTL